MVSASLAEAAAYVYIGPGKPVTLHVSVLGGSNRCAGRHARQVAYVTQPYLIRDTDSAAVRKAMYDLNVVLASERAIDGVPGQLCGRCSSHLSQVPQ